MSAKLYEISFLLDDALHQFRFQGTGQLAGEIRQALESDMTQIDMMRKSDLQVYCVENFEPGSATELLLTLTDAAGFKQVDDYDGKVDIEALALEVDAAAAINTDSTVLVEFVWDNGGGDDNPFSQDFRTNASQSPLNNRFAEKVEAFLDEHCCVYDFVFADADQAHETLSVADAVRATCDVLIDAGVAPVQLSAIATAQTLETQTPQGTQRSVRRPTL